MAGYTVHSVCPDKRLGKWSVPQYMILKEIRLTVRKRGHNFALNATFDEVEAKDYHALVIPGGRASEYIRLNKKVLEMVKHFDEENKPIAAICHGPQILTAAGVLKGREMCRISSSSSDIEVAGGKYINLSMDKAHVEGNLVTAPAWPAHPDWLAKLLKVLGAEIKKI